MARLPMDTMSQQEIQEAKDRVAMKSFDHLRRWLEASHRGFIVFVTGDLLSALPQAQDAELVQQLIALYRMHRNGIRYDVRSEVDETTGETISVDVTKDDRLTLAEKDRLVRELVADLKDADPAWSLDVEPIG